MPESGCCGPERHPLQGHASAGAIVTPSTLTGAQAAGLKAPEFLDRNDAYNDFAPLGDLLVPGPRSTNVNDLRALLIV